MSAGQITTSTGWSYPITDEDLLWLARAVKYEGDPTTYAATAWTLAQRYALVRSTYPTFAALIRAYAQPINPLWSRTGSKCGPGGSHVGTDSCSDRALDIRDRAVNDPVPEQLAWARRWAAGEIPNPVPKAVHYAVPRLVEQKIASGELVRSVACIGTPFQNCYASTTTSERWSPDRVRVGGATAVEVAATAGGGLLALVGLGAIGFYLWRRS